MTPSTAGYKAKLRSINWMTASLLTVWVLLVSLAAESLGYPQQSALQAGEQSMLSPNVEYKMDQAICKIYMQAKDLLDS